MEIPDHCTCLLWNLYADQEATVRTGHGTMDWFQIGKGVRQGCILLPCLFNLYAEYIMWNARLDEAQDGIKISGKNINNLRYVDDITLMTESKEELKSLLMKVKEEWKSWLKTQHSKNEDYGLSPITSWQIDGETMKTGTDFIFCGSKITADGGCHHEIKRFLLLGKKAMTNLDSTFKSRDITLPTNVRIVKAMVFSSSHVWMWELDHKEDWMPKNWCFWVVVLEKIPESPLDSKENQQVNSKGNQSWIFIGRTDAEAETPILWPRDAKSQFIRKDVDAGKDWKQEEKGTTEDEMVGWHHRLDGREFE